MTTVILLYAYNKQRNFLSQLPSFRWSEISVTRNIADLTENSITARRRTFYCSE